MGLQYIDEDGTLKDVAGGGKIDSILDELSPFPVLNSTLFSLIKEIQENPSSVNSINLAPDDERTEKVSISGRDLNASMENFGILWSMIGTKTNAWIPTSSYRVLTEADRRTYYCDLKLADDYSIGIVAAQCGWYQWEQRTIVFPFAFSEIPTVITNSSFIGLIEDSNRIDSWAVDAFKPYNVTTTSF